MAIRSISILKSYFNTGDKPTESQFGDLIDSFFHKSLSIPQSSIENLTAFLNSKVDKETGKGLSSNDLTDFLLSQIQSIENKVDKENGKGLSSNDFTNALLSKLNELNNYQKPISEEISYINGLNEALNSKSNVATTVTSVNGVIPINGSVIIPALSKYNINETPSEHNYTYFEKNVMVVVIPVSTGSVSGNNVSFNHNLGVLDYVRLDVRSEVGVSLPFSAFDANVNNLTITDETTSGLENSDYIYLEYTRISDQQGVSFDTLGSDSIGN